MSHARNRAPRTVLAAFLCLGVAAPVFGQEQAKPEERASALDPAAAVYLGGRPAKRPDLALVLSGGGARGAAHIGVLKVLEELHVVPDLIVGTSMGSIVGGLYAAGYSPAEIESVLADVDWGATFVDRIPRPDRSFRRKQDDNQAILIPLKLRFQGMKPYLPSGVLGGQNIESMLRSLTERATTAPKFDDLPIPYRAVAADIETGEAVIIGEGSLADAMRASMSIAGTFPPAEIAGRRLVDGGAVANVPVGIAQQLGARRVIVVDISSPLDADVQQKSFLGIMSQLTGMLTTGNRAVDIARVRPDDVLIRPDLRDVTFTDFKKAREAVAYGEEAAREQLERLRAFAAPADRWTAFEAQHRRAGFPQVPVKEVKIDNGSWVSDEIVRANLAVPTGVPLDEPRLRDRIAKLYALEYFGRVIDEFETVDGEGVLTIRTPPKPYSRGSLQFGMSFESDFEGDATYGLTVRHAVLAVNRRAGEWINVAQVGSDIVFSSEFYQPFDAKLRWFVAPAVEYQRRTQSLWLNTQPIADFSLSGYGARVDAGRVLGNWGSVKLQAFRFAGSATTRIGLPIFPDVDVDDGGVAFQFEVDTQDSVAFPTRGTRGGLRVEKYLESFGSDTDGEIVSAKVDHAISFGKNTFVLGVEAASDESDRGAARGSIVLGGFLRLSGLGRNELVGTKGGLARAVYYRDFVTLNLGSLSNRVFFGASLEAGNAYEENDPITWASLRLGGAVFVGADTVAGPMYLGWGRTEPHRDHFYFVFGRRF